MFSENKFEVTNELEYYDPFSIIIRTFVISLLIHEMLIFSRNGKSYFTTCFLPVFGLCLLRYQLMFIHIMLVSICIAILLFPGFWFLYPILFVLLSIVIASYSMRLANHLVLAWFISLLLTINAILYGREEVKVNTFIIVGIQSLIISTYLISFIHKINKDYFTYSRSCGSGLSNLYLNYINVKNHHFRHFFSLAGIYGTLFLEISIPVLLINETTRFAGLIMAIILHMFLGFLCHIHFSSLMYSGLLAFIPISDISSSFGISYFFIIFPLLIILGVWLGFRFGIVDIFVNKVLSRLLQMIFGVYSLVMIFIVLTFGLENISNLNFFTTLDNFQVFVMTGILILFIFNGICPYLGIKTEYSFAMFSNLRYDRIKITSPLGKLQRVDLAEYIIIERIEGLPEKGSHDGGWIVDYILMCFRFYDRQKYTRYFFYEGLQFIYKNSNKKKPIKITFIENGQRIQLEDYAKEMNQLRPNYQKIVLFPYKLPIDPYIPHCL
jgi:hypothetical protein